VSERIDVPTKKRFVGGPTGVAFEEFFDRDRLEAIGVGGVVGSEYVVNGVKECSADSVKTCW